MKEKKIRMNFSLDKTTPGKLEDLKKGLNRPSKSNIVQVLIDSKHQELAYESPELLKGEKR